MEEPKPQELENEVEAVFGTRLPEPPSAKQQSWGALISIIVIVLMIIIGAFYSWGKRLSEQPSYPATTTDQVAP